MPDEQTVIARRDGRVGRIVLNRPQALNALDLAMIRACTRALGQWRDDPHVHGVVIEGAGDRAFCAGGDVRALRQVPNWMASTTRPRRSSARNMCSTS